MYGLVESKNVLDPFSWGGGKHWSGRRKRRVGMGETEKEKTLKAEGKIRTPGQGIPQIGAPTRDEGTTCGREARVSEGEVPGEANSILEKKNCETTAPYRDQQRYNSEPAAGSQ